MGKWVAAEVLDEALGRISCATRMVALPGQPADYDAANASRLADVGMGAGDFAIEAAGGGRLLVVAAKTAIPVVAAGTADHVALVDDATSRLLYVTSCAAEALEVGGTVNIDSWSVEIGAPV